VAFHLLGQAAPGMTRDLPPNVRYHGTEPYEMVPHWLAAMDVGLCLYRPGPADFNSPLKLFDYMASGLAVVATAHPQMRQVFAELGQPDLLVPAGDAHALADALLGLSGDRERVRRLGRAGRQRVVEHYNWRRATRDALDAIEALRG
jgi:glycosyltransferase involved in cell wall biosynthesis